jgi:bifunctional enzyme CysN/CysC
VCNLNLDRPVPFDRYADNRDTAGFIVIDRITNNTVGCGMLHPLTGAIESEARGMS